MKVYLFGPMRGYKDFNFPAFSNATIRLRGLGHEVFSPAEHDMKGGFDNRGDGSDEDLSNKGFDLRAALGADLAYITGEAEVLVGLPGWEKSLGSRAEVFTAWTLRIPVFTLASFLAGSRGPASQLRPEDLNA